MTLLIINNKIAKLNNKFLRYTPNQIAAILGNCYIGVMKIGSE